VRPQTFKNPNKRQSQFLAGKEAQKEEWKRVGENFRFDQESRNAGYFVGRALRLQMEGRPPCRPRFFL
jgi:hypothetical protein